MFKVMENEVEIFRAWLKKIVKEDKIIKGKTLADELGIPATRISYYHSGRVDNGIRTFPSIPFDIRKKILKITNTPYMEMMEMGRQELNPTAKNLSEDKIRQIAAEEAAKATAQTDRKGPTDNNIVDYQDPYRVKHHKKINEFPDQERAYVLNKIAVDLAKEGSDQLEKLIEYAQFLKNKIQDKKEGAQKQAVNGLGK